MNITEKQYQFALDRIEDLLPLVSGEDPDEEKAVELSIYSDIVIEYENEHYPILKNGVWRGREAEKCAAVLKKGLI